MKSVARIKRVFRELKRRKVFHVASIYLITAWGASLGAAELFPAFGVPDWGVRAFVITAALGLPIALVLAWAFEITPDGVVLDPGDSPQSAQSAYPSVDDATTTWFQSQGVTARWTDESEESAIDFYSAFVIGRDAQAELRLDNNRVSRRHARVFYEKGCWWLEDLSSRNGTILNGRQITEPTRLLDANEVSLFDGGPTISLVQHAANETIMDENEAQGS